MVDVKKVVLGVIFLIIFIILVFQLVGNSAVNLRDAADSVTDSNNCTDGTDSTGTALKYNFTSKYCYNSTYDALYVAKQYDLPLNTLFGRGAVLLIIFMAVILILAVSTVIKGLKEK